MKDSDFPSDKIPLVEFAAEKGLEELYMLAWHQAWNHVREFPGMPQSPYMDEGFADDRIWIWDTCFMVQFCKYAFDSFPGAVSLDNFYKPLLDKTPTPMPIHHPDNPPLPAWAEYSSYILSGNRERMKKVMVENRYLQRFFELFDSYRPGPAPEGAIWKVYLEKTKLGYHWLGGSSGMDNTPRGGVPATEENADAIYRKMLWIDALGQQALNARLISELAEEFDLPEDAKHYAEKHDELSSLLNKYYWNEEDGFYYDIEAEGEHRHIKVKTPASYWPLIAGAASKDQAEKMARHAADPEIFGGSIPWPTVARNSKDFRKEGCYWRGGVWLPTAYMAIKALEKYKQFKVADESAFNLVMHQYRTWKNYEPHTIWEAYSPTEAKPSTNRSIDGSKLVRKDFCGWSALGPICLMIENILGFDVNAPQNRIKWRLHQTCRHGIRNLRFGKCKASLIYDGNGRVQIDSDNDFSLEINNTAIEVKKGKSEFTAEPSI